MFSRGLSPGVTSGPFRNTLGFGAKAGSPRMRLRLFERLGRLVGWRPGSAGRWQWQAGRLPGRRRGRRRQAPAGTPAPAPGSRRRRPRARASGLRPRPCSRRPGCRVRGRPPAAVAAGRARRRAPPNARPAVRPCRRCRGTTRPTAGGAARRRRRRPGPDQGGAAVRRRPGGDRHPRAGRRQPAARGGPQAALVPGRRRAGGPPAGLPAERRRPSRAPPPRRGRRRPRGSARSAARARLARDPAKAALPFAAPHPRGYPATGRRPAALRSA